MALHKREGRLVTARGLFIVLEGADGSGKTVQARRLAARLGTGNRLVLATREPSDGPIGQRIRQALRGAIAVAPAEMGALFAADRLDHAAREILPTLAMGAVVVCDRYDWSNLVYRAAETEGPLYRCLVCGWEGEPDEAGPLATLATCPRCLVAPLPFAREVLARMAWARNLSRGAPIADVTVVLALPVAIATERRERRDGAAREAYDGDRIQARCCALYARAAELAEPGERVVVIDGHDDEDAVAERVWAAVAPVLAGGPR